MPGRAFDCRERSHRITDERRQPHSCGIDKSADPISQGVDRGKRNDHVASELITGWSYSPQKQIGGNQVPGLWLTGNALRLLERDRPGVLYADLVACNEYAIGEASAAKVRCPVLAILGARDLMAPAKNARALISAIAGAKVVTIPDCGHALMAEEPDAVLDALRAFLMPAT
jgi:pimeloyl-ACP methyl ester carboxylesterase